MSEFWSDAIWLSGSFSLGWILRPFGDAFVGAIWAVIRAAKLERAANKISARQRDEGAK